MSEYIDELVYGISGGQKLDRFDALMGILNSHVLDATAMDACDDIYPLLDKVMKAAYSFGPYPFDDDSVDIGNLTDIQKAYLHGEFTAYANILSLLAHQRPTQANIDCANVNIELLRKIDENHYEYKKDYDELFYNGLVVTYQHGTTRVCRLTPFAKQMLLRNK
jgi:hypothetical protein